MGDASGRHRESATDPLGAAFTRPRFRVRVSAFAGWVVSMVAASMVVVAMGGTLTRYGPITGLPRLPLLTIVVGFAYWPCFVAIRWLIASRRQV